MQPQRVCHDTLPWLISISLGLMRVAVSLLFVLCALLSFATANPQAKVWQPSPGHTQIPIWPKEPPNAEAVPGSEVLEPPDDFRVAGKPIVAVTNVTRPTMTIYSPKGKNTGAAVVVFPGGGLSDSGDRSGRNGGLRLADV